MPENEKDIAVTVMTKEKLREFVREEVRKALAEAGIHPGVDSYKLLIDHTERAIRISAEARKHDKS